MIDSVRKSPKTAKWEFDYKDLKGKRKTKKGFKTKAEAERAQAKRFEELNKGINPINKKRSRRALFKASRKYKLQTLNLSNLSRLLK